MVTKALRCLLMRRALVLTNETARHSFRASLPASVTQMGAGEVEARVPWRKRLGMEMGREDVRSVLMTYCAGFIATTAFIV